MQNRRNYYRILHVQPGAPAEIIRMSYRTLMRRLKMHPDLGGDHWNAALINEAFATLNNAEKRAAYDLAMASLFNRQRNPPEAEPPAPRLLTAGGSESRPVERHSCPFCGTLHSAREASKPDAVCVYCDSALFPASKVIGGDLSRRVLIRTRRVLPITFFLYWPQKDAFAGTTEDISISGTCFTTELEMVPGERPRIECEFCSAVGTVRHCRRQSNDPASLWYVGVEFITVLIKQTRGTFLSTNV